MTVAICWIRQVNSCQELIIASDSRLCGGHRWDQCPKILTLPRSDCAICFAGGTDYAYPMMMQIYFAAGEQNRLTDRAMDIMHFNGYVLKYINELKDAIVESADPDSIVENEFIFGGYSWIRKCFMIWRYYYSAKENKFLKHEIVKNYLNIGKIAIAGDKKRELVTELKAILLEKYGKNFETPNNNGFNMEPLEALISLLRKVDNKETIGGAPQIVKIYQHMNCKPIGVYWPSKTDSARANRTLLGRKMLDFENTNYWFLDPDTLKTSACTTNID